MHLNMLVYVCIVCILHVACMHVCTVVLYLHCQIKVVAETMNAAHGSELRKILEDKYGVDKVRWDLY